MGKQAHVPHTRGTSASSVRPEGALSDEVLRGLVGYQLKRAQINVYESFAKRLREFNLTPGHFGALLLIGANSGATQKALADTIGCNRSLIVRILDQLERHGMVMRKPVPLDRRSHAVCPTRKGRKLIETLKREVVEHEQRATAALTRQETKTLQSLLRRLNGAESKTAE